jgi:hypothetical protein
MADYYFLRPAENHGVLEIEYLLSNMINAPKVSAFFSYLINYGR